MHNPKCSKPSSKINSSSKKQVNSLSTSELNDVVSFLKHSTFRRGDQSFKYVECTPEGYWKCNLQPTKTSTGDPKYAQIDLERFASIWGRHLGKQLVHLIWWRAHNNGQLLHPDLHISHRSINTRTLDLIEETREMNESRKYCHLFGWYKPLPNEDKPRCPHWEAPCNDY